MNSDPHFLENCLFFNTNVLSRYLLKLAQKEFKELNISPAHASLMLMVYDAPGISPKHLSRQLYLSPSTITRFIDALEKKKLVIRTVKGKAALISPSRKGLRTKGAIAAAYKRLVEKYTEFLGPDMAHPLTFSIHHANRKLASWSEENDKKL